MTTSRDLLLTVLDTAPGRPPEQGELSLALAGAELIDLLAARAVGLDGDRIVPRDQPAVGDHLLAEAAAAVVRQAPYESVEDWLWRRGRGLAQAYLAALEAEGLLTRQRSRRLLSRAGHPAPADTADRRRAVDRWAADEPVLAALGAALGVRGESAGEPPVGEPPPVTDDVDDVDDVVAAVLAAVNDALLELEAVRQRRAIEEAAFDNVWRGV
ncbi:GPP34 family phosphoprotein [Streptomyces sclerotialus]|uniref:GPP34 family phosphoprotein n=1 Tax=Streptomyces sclerotialus TaxID=1957 RepID=UPI0004C5E304